MLVVLALAVLFERLDLRLPLSGPAETGAAAIEEAFRAERSDLIVEASGIVDKILRDDRDGARHQRFVLRLDGGRTVLIAHNIDLAPRVPLERGDRVRFRGEYEWNEKGGVVHWTHRDPDGGHPHGFVEHAGRRYE